MRLRRQRREEPGLGSKTGGGIVKRFVMAMLLGLGLSAPAMAGHYYGRIKPYFWSTALYLDANAASMDSRPACATRNTVRLQETDPNDPVYKHKFAMLLAAWLAGQSVEMWGTGTCTTEGDEIIHVIVPVSF
jgi:hypothetical protein